ncbi:MAG: hypothetical protein HC887_11955 [Desulfobacteraceae bacterium]|nr:hypothetical protein [Desulfobacteraceae bacterium]
MRLIQSVIIIMFLGIFSCVSAKENKLVVAVGKDDYITSGPRVNLGRYPLNANIFESLTTFDEQFRLRPCLAESWEYKGNKTWRFHLKKGVKFHDGSLLDAAAVRLSLENQAKSGTLLFDFVRIDDSLKDSIDITTTEENLILPYILSHPYLGIVKPAKIPVGTGPFCFVRYERDQYLEVGKNENYPGEKAKTDRIIFRFISDNSSRLMAFESGEADILADVPYETVPSLKENRQYAIHLSAVGSYTGIMLSTAGELKDKNIRKAIAMSLDRNAINRALWQGTERFARRFLRLLFWENMRN